MRHYNSVPDTLIRQLCNVPLLAITAPSGTGKTVLLCKLIPRLAAAGLRVGVIKHSHHAIEVDYPGKDSFLLRHAGATQLLIASAHRTTFIIDHTVVHEISLNDLVSALRLEALDLVLIEGLKDSPVAKLELQRTGVEQPNRFRHDATIIGLITDSPTLLTDPASLSIPVLDLNDLDQITQFILAYREAALTHNAALEEVS